MVLYRNRPDADSFSRFCTFVVLTFPSGLKVFMGFLKAFSLTEELKRTVNNKDTLYKDG